MLGLAAGAQAQTLSKTLSISGPASANEGNSSTRDLTYTVSLSQAVPATTVFKVCFTGTATLETGDGNISANADYQIRINTSPNTTGDNCTSNLGIHQGSALSNTSIKIRVKGDTNAESDETVIATLSIGGTNAGGVILGTSTHTHTIFDDDGDTTAPQITSITRQTPSALRTNADTLKWRVTFDEAVQNVDAADFSVDGTTATITVANVSSSTYDITVTGGDLASRNTIVTLEFDNNQNIQDTSGNALTNLTPTGTDHSTYDVDNLRPRVRSFERQNPTTQSTSADTLIWRVAFNEAVKNVNGADFVIHGTTATITQVTKVTGQSATYDLTVTGGNLAGLNGTVRLGFNTSGHNIHDIAGNRLGSYARLLTDHNTFNVVNTAANNAPTVANAIPNQSATVGVAFSYAFPANTFNDADNDSLTYTATKSDNTALPTWLTFTVGTRTFSGTPQSGDVGTLSVKVTASDGNGGSVYDTFDITVNAPAQPSVSFGSASSSAIENSTDGSRTVRVNLSSAAPSGGLTLSYTVTGTATQGSDFTIQSSGTLMIPQDNTRASIELNVIDDNLQESDETVILTLNDGTGYTVNSTKNVHTLTVRDNGDPQPVAASFDSATSSVREDVGTHNVTINLSPAAPSGGLTLTYTVTGSATAGSDYTTLTGTVPVAANATTVNIPVVITDDSEDDDNETIILTLTSGTGYTLGDTTFHTLTITDNDTTTHPDPTPPTTNPGNNNNNNNTPPTAPVIPPVSVSAQALTLTEGAMESYTLVLDSAPTTSVTIEITPQDSTRITVTPATVVFTPDNWQSPQSVSVRATDDSAATGQTVQLNHTLAGSEQIIDSITITIQKRAVITDEIPTTPWVSRMGRTLAEQAIDGIRNRMNASRTPGLTATLAGWSVPMHSSSGEFDKTYTHPAASNPAGQTLNAQDIFSNSQFIHTTGLDLRGGNTAFWGQLSETDFSGTQHDLHTQGESRTLNIGADYVVHDWMTGISLLSNSTKGTQQRQAITERMESNLTALIPYSARETGETRIWGAAGFGQGTVSRYREDRKSNPSDVTWQMLNLGVSREIRTTETATLSLDTDALWVRTQSDESRQDNMNPSISRIRAGLQSTWNHTLYNTELQPSLTVGVRHDGGGAESGFGLYAGSGLHWTSATVQMDIEGQVVLSHQQEIEESGFSASLIHDANPHSELGFSLSLSQASLLTIDGLDSWYLQESLMPTTNDSRWSMDAAYGLSAWDGRFTGSPHIGLGLSGDRRDIQLGWRMTPLATNQNLSLGIQATRLTQEQTAPKHWFGVEARVRW